MQTYNNLPQQQREFIPIYEIDGIMMNVFHTYTSIYDYSVMNKLYKIKLSNVIDAMITGNIINWDFNRPVDNTRSYEIARYIFNEKQHIEGMIYLSYNNKTNKFDVIDGIHRLTALSIIQSNNCLDTNYITPSEFGSNKDAVWLYEQQLIVNIRFNSTNGSLIDVFQNINKCQIVPELYTNKDTSLIKRNIINNIANEWQVKYKKHFSSSLNPMVGNTNLYNFTELLTIIYEKYIIDEHLITNIINDKLEEININIKTNIPKKISVNARIRCVESGCYVFLYKNDEIIRKYI
jgi:hypothetical protein